MPDAIATYTPAPRHSSSTEINKIACELRSNFFLADAYGRKGHDAYIKNDKKRDEVTAPLFDKIYALAAQLAQVEAKSPHSMIERAQTLLTCFPDILDGHASNDAVSALIKTVVTDFANLLLRPVTPTTPAAPPPRFTQEQTEEILQFCRSASVIAEVSCVTALQWMPQIFTYLPSSETDVAKDAAASIGHVSEYLKDLTAARITLRKAGVLNVV